MKLGVNVDHIATLREARKTNVPDPLRAARICERSGADSIVCHLREDRRHINDQDLRNLRKAVHIKLNLEMSCAEEIVKIALQVGPDQATLVPERRAEVTTEGGLDVVANQKTVKTVVEKLSSAGVEVSLFIDPDNRQIQTAKDVGVKCIELHTGRYANASNADQVKLELAHLVNSADFASSLKLRVFAGHGLNYENVQRVCEIENIEELNIGHSIISRAIFVGLENAVREMLRLIGG